MASFDNVTYEFYTDTMGRSLVPDAATFALYELANVLFVDQLVSDGIIAERKENGFACAVCMMIEEDYTNSQTLSGESAPEVSASIGGFSYSVGSKAADLAAEKNFRSLAERKYAWLRLYCDISSGVTNE